MESSQVSTERWAGKWNCVKIHNGWASALTRKEILGHCHNMDEPWGYYANKWNVPATKRQCYITT